MSETKPTARAVPPATPPEGTPRAGRGRPGMGPGRRLVVASAGVLTLLVALGAFGSIVLLAYFDSTRPTVEVPVDRPAGPREPVNVLVLGSDSRAGLSPGEQERVGGPEEVSGQRSDTIILVHLDPRREQAVMVHFPRDLLVEIPGHGEGKINEAFALGGPELIVRTVRRFAGLPIHHYVQIDFVGFRSLVQALGGVRLCVDRPMHDELAGLSIPRAGCHVLNGRQALAFVRARNVEGDLIPDFARIARQQQFIRALTNRLLSVGSLVRLPNLVRLAGENVTTDEELSGTDLLFVADKLREVAARDPGGGRSIDLRVVPSVPQDIDGVSYVVAQQPEARRLFSALEEGRRLGDLGKVQLGTAVSPAVIRVRVLRVEGAPAADGVERLLRRAGFVVLPTEDAPPDLEESVILFRRGGEDRAETVSGYFPHLEDRRGPRRLLRGTDVVVVVAEDYGA